MTCKRLREACPEYDAQLKRRRLVGGVQAPKSNVRVRQLDLTLKRVMQIVEPHDITKEPDAATVQKLRDARHRFPDAHVMRRLFVPCGAVLHERLLDVLLHPSPAADRSLVESVITRMRNSGRPTYRNRKDVSVALAKFREAGQNLVDWCVLGGSPRGLDLRVCVVLVCSSGLEEQDLRRAVKERLLQVEHYRSLRRENKRLKHYPVQVYLQTFEDKTPAPRAAHLLQRLQERPPKPSLEHRVRQMSPWHNELFEKMLALERSVQRTAYPERRLAVRSYQFARVLLQLEAAASARGQTLQSFLRNASSRDLESTVRDLLLTVQARPQNVKNQQIARHQATGWARASMHFLRGCLADCLGCDALHFTESHLLRGVPNRGTRADPTTRRTLTDEEIAAMLDAAKDPAEEVLVTLLREVALRSSALGHLRYRDLLDEHHMPRAECCVREKGATTRFFTPSVTLQGKIKRLAEFLRAHLPACSSLRDCYVLNLCDPAQPFRYVYHTVRRLARDAGLKGVRVHPHMFRHTLVHTLVRVGNSMDLVSKFLGHADVKTTSYYYWVPTSAQLSSMFVNPFFGDATPRLRDAKMQALRHLLTLTQRHCDMAAVRRECPHFDTLLGEVEEEEEEEGHDDRASEAQSACSADFL